MKLFMGVDVGANGGIALIDQNGAVLRATKMPETDADLLDELSWATRECPLVPVRATLEKVHATPQMGVTSAFSFGGSYRACRMALAAARIPFDEVSPFKWQRRMECLTARDKNVSKARAQQIFPTQKITHWSADALLLAEYCRLTQHVEEHTL